MLPSLTAGFTPFPNDYHTSDLSFFSRNTKWAPSFNVRVLFHIKTAYLFIQSGLSQ